MTKFKYYLRWLLVLPGSFVIGFLATFPLHWIIILLFSNSKDPVIGSPMFFIQLFSDKINAYTIEYTFYPFIIALSFVYAGYIIAPKYKFRTASVMFGIYSFIWIFVVAIAIFNLFSSFGLHSKFELRTVLALFGALLGFLSTRKKERKSRTKVVAQ